MRIHLDCNASKKLNLCCNHYDVIKTYIISVKVINKMEDHVIVNEKSIPPHYQCLF